MSAGLGESPPRRRFKKYPAYKDSGVEWLGEIPAHWVLTKMWDVSRAISGGTPAKEERRYWDGDVPWVSPKDMKRRFIDSAEDSVTEAAITETGLKLIPPPAVLVVVRGMILAHTYPVAITRVPVTINQDMKALQLRHDLDPEFFGYWLQGVGRELLAVIVEEAAHGTKAIRMDRWRVTPVEVPPKAEQHAIAAFLDRETARIDALVAKKERLIELLQEKRTALITRSVTKGLDPNTVMKESGIEWLGEIPAHWDLGPLGRWWDVIDCKHRTVSFLDEGVAVASIGEVQGLQVDLSNAKRTSAEEYGRMIDGGRDPKPGDIVYSRNATVGAAALVTTDQPFCMGQDVSLIRSAIQDQRFLVFLLRSPVVMSQLDAMMVGSTFNRINVGRIKRLFVAVPPGGEQHEIAEFCSRRHERTQHLIDKVRSAIDRLKEFRTALISAAVTGKIDVREEGNRTSAVLARG